MKKIILPFLLLSFCSSLFAQKQFEGKVTHKLSGDEKKSGSAEIYFGKQKIKGVLKPNNADEAGKDDIIFDFTKGLVYHVNSVAKTYRFDSLRKRSFDSFEKLAPDAAKNRIVLGHRASAYTIKDTAESEFFVDMKMNLWYADSLAFFVEEKYLAGEDLNIFTNGKTICLGMEMSMSLNGENKAFELSPISIEPSVIPDSFFEIPSDFTLEIDEAPLADSAMGIEEVLIDTVAVKKPASKAKPKKSPAKPAKPKQQVKSSAVKPKSN